MALYVGDAIGGEEFPDMERDEAAPFAGTMLLGEQSHRIARNCLLVRKRTAAQGMDGSVGGAEIERIGHGLPFRGKRADDGGSRKTGHTEPTTPERWFSGSDRGGLPAGTRTEVNVPVLLLWRPFHSTARVELPFRVQRATVALPAQAINRVMAKSPGLTTPKAKAP